MGSAELRSSILQAVLGPWRIVRAAGNWGLSIVGSLFREPQPDLMTHTGRGFAYAVTSILALATGYLLRPGNEWGWETVLILIPISLSVPFFVVYACLFHYEDPGKIINQDIYRNSQKNAFFTAAVAFAGLSMMILMIYRIATGQFPCKSVIISCTAYGILFSSYALFLYLNQSTASHRLVRHILVWPVVMSISISLYFGQYFSCSTSSLRYLLPIAILIVFFLLSERLAFSGGQLAVSGSAIYVLFLSVLSLGKYNLIAEPDRDYFLSMVVAIPIAAYLAALESWRVTAYVSETANYLVSHGEPVVHEPTNYYYSTLAVLTFSGLLIPFVYVFSDFGIVFLVGFSLHSIAAYLFWFQTAKSLPILQQNRMGFWKVVAGLALLVVMVVDSKTKVFLNREFLPRSSQIILMILVAVCMLLLRGVGGMLKSLPMPVGASVKEKIKTLYGTHEIYPVTVAFGSLFMCIVMFGARELQEQGVIVNKISTAIWTYLAWIFMSQVYMGRTYIKKSGIVSSAAVFLQGVILTTHLVTSVMAGALVFASAMLRGSGIGGSSAESLPFVFAAMGGFALNDFFDVKRDAINEPNRAIPSKRLQRTEVLYISLILLATAICGALTVSTQVSQLFLYFAAVVGVIVYNVVISKAAIIKNIITAMICVTPAAYIMLVHEHSIGHFPFILSFVLFITGREILMDVKDLRGDSLVGVRTIPVRWGIRRARFAANMLVLLSSAVLLIPTLEKTRSVNILLCVVLIVLAAFDQWFWRDDSRKRQRMIIGVMRYQMMITGIYMLVW
jgi:4-hydroxybenzoate polyprenyltransferase